MLRPLRFVVDTNVMISRLFFRQSAPALAVRHAAERMQLLVSPETLLELEQVLARPKFERYLSTDTRLQFLHRLRRTARMVSETADVKVCRDPRDDKFLSLAAAGHASLLLSGDKDLLALDPFQDVRILSPRQYLESLQTGGE